MEVLPIKGIREEDGPVVGNNLLNLAKLYQSGFPVAEGIIVTPPSLKFKTILEHFKFKDREVFEQSLHIVKSEIIKIPPPLELENILSRRKIDSKKVWLNLLDGWLSQVRSKIWREGFSSKLTANLTSETVLFTDKITASGEVYFDYDQNLAIVKTNLGNITPDLVVQFDDLIKRANKKLFLPQVYFWIFDGSIKIVKVSEFTQYLIDEKAPTIRYKETEKNEHVTNAIKVFLELDDDFKTANGIDGILIKGEKIPDLDKKILQLVEAGLTLPNSPVIFRLSDISQGFGSVRGTLKLIHNDIILKKETEAFLFARNKRSLPFSDEKGKKNFYLAPLLNLQIGIPFTRSVQEFLQLKRDLAVLGISRKGSLKLWFEIGAPENILNLEDYLTAGFDGAIINLDELAAWLGGFNPEEAESIFYKKQVNALIIFLSDGMKILHKAKIPMLASGKLAFHDDVLAFLVSNGIWGVSVDFSNVISVHEHLRYAEKRNLRGKLAII